MALAAIELNSEVPIEPPSCWPVLTVAEATPASRGGIPNVPVFIDVENNVPMPRPVINTGTFGVAPQDAGVASASVNTGQQLGGSIGTSLLNTIAASATTSYVVAHIASAGRNQLAIKGVQAAGLVHGYTTVFWWCAAIFLGGAIVCGSLMRRGPLQAPGALEGGPAETPTVAYDRSALRPGRARRG